MLSLSRSSFGRPTDEVRLLIALKLKSTSRSSPVNPLKASTIQWHALVLLAFRRKVEAADASSGPEKLNTSGNSIGVIGLDTSIVSLVVNIAFPSPPGAGFV